MTMTAADALIERLIDWNVDTIFGLPGDGINGIMEAALNTPRPVVIEAVVDPTSHLCRPKSRATRSSNSPSRWCEASQTAARSR
jgi:thiamine pyrophosphate-dependent acetolactate synthase large subunit-like protein